MSVRFSWSKVLFKFSVSFFIYCLDDLSIFESEVLKSLTITVLLSITPFVSVSICLTYFDALMLSAIYLMIVISS